MDSYTSDGVHAHPLHKRDTPKVSSAATPPAPSTLPKTSNIQPSTLNQKPVTSSNTNTQKSQTPVVAPRPVSQSNIQPNLASSSRVRRDAPRTTDVKNAAPQPATSNVAKSAPQPTNAPVKTSAQQQPTKNLSSAQSPRITRDAPKVVDQKTAQQPAVAAKAQQPAVAPKTPAQDAKTPVTVTRKVRDVPTEQSKSSPQVKDHKDESSESAEDSKTPVHALGLAKRDPPTQNVNSQTSTSTNGNQRPSLVHPVPVDQILKKPGTVTV